MIRNQSGQTISCNIRDATTGAAYTGTVTIYIDGDGSGQILGSVNGGVCTSRGHGEFSYAPSAAETNYAHIAFTFDGVNALGDTIQVETLTAAEALTLQTATTPGATTVGDLITAALRRINVLAAGETASPEDMADGFLRFNDFVDSLAIERLTIYTITRTTWTLNSTKGVPGNPYTIGAAGDIAIARPIYLDHVNYQDTSFSPTLERPLTLLTADAYAAIPMKTLTSALPSMAYYEPTNLTGSLYLYMIPTSSTLQGVLYAPTATAKFGAVTDGLALPPGYNRFLRDNLALEFWPEWRENVPVDPALMKSATESKAAIKAANVRMVDAMLDAAVLAGHGIRYSIYADGA